ncbi:BamA/TamA family outer membrane protein [Aliarcobacter cryaerophilus]|uniref:autotransporter assembly complex protein TamA n=1 Tax=Aliarcobacter cryaerophilus TaxID=28198 RepID=UPI0021B6E315|nr:BamA/TamA family outer membrane protein [Aliarcobacter cryaerophilus]MCT7539623.1 BamA/TamA family outer membrane protein [Aliarcobacter cryaerophilus]
MFKIFLIISILFLNSLANDIKTIEYKGDIDLVLGDFSKSNLDAICGFSYPEIYKIWKKNPTFTSKDIENCSELLKEYLQSLGFYRAKIDYEIKNDIATINIFKNEAIKVSSIKVEDEYKKFVNFRKDEVFISSKFSESKKNIRKYLNENGYAKADINAKAYVNLDEYKVELIYIIIKNKLQYFGDINIQNSANLTQELLQKHIEFKKGDIYNSRLLDKTYENLYNFGIYKTIIVEPNFNSNSDFIPVNIKLEEGFFKENSFGFGYDTDKKFRFKAQHKNENFLGDLKHFTVGTKVNSEGYELYNNIFDPYFIKDNISLNNDISYENMDYTSYSQKKIENKLTFSKEIFTLPNSVGFLAEHSTIKSDLKEYKSGTYLLNSLFYEIKLDRRDDSLNPKDGYFLSFYIEDGSKFIGSEYDYLKTVSDLKYIKTFDNLTASFKTKIGTLDRDLPIFKHFFAGGAYSNRGYAYEKVGVKDSDDNPYGGLSMIDSSLEFEYNIYKNIGIVTFFDSTMLSLESNNFNDKFYNSFGFGARYYTPIGPFRVDFGFPKDDGGFVFHIGIGQVF